MDFSSKIPIYLQLHDHFQKNDFVRWVGNGYANFFREKSSVRGACKREHRTTRYDFLSA